MYTDVSRVPGCLHHQGWRGLHIALMMKAASTSGTSVKLNQTSWRNSSENSHFHTGIVFETKSEEEHGNSVDQ
jgi:hypothetical protein